MKHREIMEFCKWLHLIYCIKATDWQMVQIPRKSKQISRPDNKHKTLCAVVLFPKLSSPTVEIKLKIPGLDEGNTSPLPCPTASWSTLILPRLISLSCRAHPPTQPQSRRKPGLPVSQEAPVAHAIDSAAQCLRNSCLNVTRGTRGMTQTFPRHRYLPR